MRSTWSATEGATSALMTFEAFQSRCLDPGSPMEVKSCVEQMNGALRTSQEDIVALGRRVNRMKEDLQELVLKLVELQNICPS